MPHPPELAGASLEQYRGTTILSVRRGNTVVVGGDGQVSIGQTIMKANARKVRRLYKDTVFAGFAGGTADAFTLFERFEKQLDKYSGQSDPRRRGTRKGLAHRSARCAASKRCWWSPTPTRR